MTWFSHSRNVPSQVYLHRTRVFPVLNVVPCSSKSPSPRHGRAATPAVRAWTVQHGWFDCWIAVKVVARTSASRVCPGSYFQFWKRLDRCHSRSWGTFVRASSISSKPITSTRLPSVVQVCDFIDPFSVSDFCDSRSLRNGVCNGQLAGTRRSFSGCRDRTLGSKSCWSCKPDGYWCQEDHCRTRTGSSSRRHPQCHCRVQASSRVCVPGRQFHRSRAATGNYRRRLQRARSPIPSRYCKHCRSCSFSFLFFV